MKKNFSFASQFILLIIIGLVISFLTGSFELNGETIYWEDLDLETILSYLNLGLPILTLAVGAGLGIFLLVRNRDGEE